MPTITAAVCLFCYMIAETLKSSKGWKRMDELGIERMIFQCGLRCAYLHAQAWSNPVHKKSSSHRTSWHTFATIKSRIYSLSRLTKYILPCNLTIKLLPYFIAKNLLSNWGVVMTGQVILEISIFPGQRWGKSLAAIEEGGHLLLLAPRRVGKTSLLRHLENNPQEGYVFLYTMDQSCNTEYEFYKEILEKLHSSSLSTDLIS